MRYLQIIKRPIQNKIVVLTFDDATASHYSVVAPLLKKYKFGAAFFVCEFQPNFNDISKYMNWRQIREFNRMRFEIANYTKTHVVISKLKNKEFLSQLEYIENKCDTLHIIKPVSFAYPGYNLNEQSIEVLQAKRYRFARAGGGRAYDPKNDHPLLIPSWAMNSKIKPEIMNAFQEASNGKIVVLTIHGVPNIEHSWVNTSPGLF